MNEIRRWAAWPFIRLYFALTGVRWGPGWRIYGAPIIQRHAGSRISIGRDFEMRNTRTSSPLGVDHPAILATWSSEASIEIGNGVGITGGSFCAMSRISIGHRVLIGANCVILDSDFHPLDAPSRRIHPASTDSAPVVIEDDVFLGTQVLVLKGSRIGKASVIGAGSVVTGEIPPNVLAAGNPARTLRSI